MATLVGKKVGPIGFGLMGFTWRSDPTPYDEAIKVMKAALDRGANFWNGGDFYGPPEANSLQLLAAYFEKYPEDADKVVLSIKGGIGPGGRPDGSETFARRAVENAVKLLGGKKKLDIFEYARVDPKVPIEETMQSLLKLVDEGLISGICLSEVNANTIRRAAKVAPIQGVEIELSLFSRQIYENGTAEACQELNIPIIAYSPLGRGFLTGQWTKPEDVPQGDLRAMMPRFQKGAFEKNLKLVDEAKKIAANKGCTPAQLAIAWVRAQPGTIIPIPGATKVERVDENLIDITLDQEELRKLQGILDSHEIEGGRYPDAASGLLEG